MERRRDVDGHRGRRRSGAAAGTVVLAVVLLFGIGSVLALYVGRLSLRRMRVEEELRGRTMAWVGVAVALFGLGLAALWIALSVTA